MQDSHPPYAIIFCLKCKEFNNEDFTGGPKEVNHHINLRLGAEFTEDPFVQVV